MAHWRGRRGMRRYMTSPGVGHQMARWWNVRRAFLDLPVFALLFFKYPAPKYSSTVCIVGRHRANVRPPVIFIFALFLTLTGVDDFRWHYTFSLSFRLRLLSFRHHTLLLSLSVFVVLFVCIIPIRCCCSPFSLLSSSFFVVGIIFRSRCRRPFSLSSSVFSLSSSFFFPASCPESVSTIHPALRKASTMVQLYKRVTNDQWTLRGQKDPLGQTTMQRLPSGGPTNATTQPVPAEQEALLGHIGHHINNSRAKEREQRSSIQPAGH